MPPVGARKECAAVGGIVLQTFGRDILFACLRVVDGRLSDRSAISLPRR